MSESVDRVAAADAVLRVAQATLSAGALLRQAREAAGMQIDALSAALKVPVKKLVALEADRHDALPDAVFTRALAASVCRTLKVDPVPILSRLPDQIMPRLQLDTSTTDRASLHEPRALWRAPLLARIPKPVVTIAGLLVLGAAVLFFWPLLKIAGLVPTIVQNVPLGAGVPGSSVVVPLAPLAATVLANTATPSETTASNAGKDGVAPATAPLDTSRTILTAADPPTPAAPPASAPLVFKARSKSWVEVVDAAGVVQLRKILNPGENALASGVMPLAAVVGRADAVEVVVRGQVLDLAPLVKDNVARFQVK